ncbi:MAG TPA: S9 family peptidase [Acidobacteriota bacterium]
MRPYGSWASPITLESLVAGSRRYAEIALDGEDIYWCEGRPQEGGRQVLLRRGASGAIRELTPAPFNVRTRVHEYGGGAFLAAAGRVYCSDFDDQRLYRIDAGGGPTPITPPRGLRFADGIYDLCRDRLIYVAEDHGDAAREPVASLVAVDPAGAAAPQVLVAGSDFYAAPRLSPDGTRLAWLSWNHPNMPWDGTELWVAELGGDGSVGARTRVAGGSTESIFQPQWSPDGVLHFVSDRSGWWNLYRQRGQRIEALTELDAELGRPHWTFGNPTYGFAGPRCIICSFTRSGRWGLARLEPESRRLEPIETPFSEIDQVHATQTHALFVGGAPLEPRSVVRIELASGALERLARSSPAAIDSGYLSVPEAIEFPSARGRTAHGLFYPPRNRDFRAPPGEKPPLLVNCHGGPTAAAGVALDLALQFWTSRGIAVLDVNYGGSSGYGRAYRERLKGQWGVVDVEDCIHGARHLAQAGRVDGARLAIRGGSAGGFTALCALAASGLFRAGASYYGVSDLERLARTSHKFEAHYLDGLVGPYPERIELYRERSPLYNADRIGCPVIFFQGLEDQVVPPEQAERMVAALRARKLPVAYVSFAGEQHGLRRSESIRRARECELAFYARVLGFEPADPVAALPIDNL